MKHSKFLAYVFVGSLAFASGASAHTVHTNNHFSGGVSAQLHLYGTVSPLNAGAGAHPVPANADGSDGIQVFFHHMVDGENILGVVDCRAKGGKKIKTLPTHDLHFEIGFDKTSGEAYCSDKVEDV